jgi:hypothetical protein
VYAFDLGTLSWQRLSSPSDPPGKDVPYAPDGGPTSRHTYNYIQYIPPPVDRFVTVGGAAFYQSGQTGTDTVDAFNFDTASWETQKFATIQGQNLIGSITAYDPMTGHLFEHGGDQGYLNELDPATNQWTAHGDMFNGSYIDYYETADIDPIRRKMVAVGNGMVWVWDLSVSGQIPGVQVTTTGDTGILATPSPGFVYDPMIQAFVAWGGGGDVYTFDVGSLSWTKLAASSTVVPTAPNGNGTFGRFRYSPTRNLFVLVNRIDDDVFVYKLSSGPGMPPPDAGLPPPDAGHPLPDGGLPADSGSGGPPDVTSEDAIGADVTSGDAIGADVTSEDAGAPDVTSTADAAPEPSGDSGVPAPDAGAIDIADGVGSSDGQALSGDPAIHGSSCACVAAGGGDPLALLLLPLLGWIARRRRADWERPQ